MSDKKIKIGFWKVFGMIGKLASELALIASDGKITVTEALGLVETICEDLGIDFDHTGFDLVRKKFDIEDYAD